MVLLIDDDRLRQAPIAVAVGVLVHAHLKDVVKVMTALALDQSVCLIFVHRGYIIPWRSRMYSKELRRLLQSKIHLWKSIRSIYAFQFMSISQKRNVARDFLFFTG